MNVLITGATGEVALGVMPTLESRFDCRRFSLDEGGDLLDWDGLQHAMQDIEAVLHLAIASGHSGTFEEDHFNDLRFDVNVKGTYHVFETARRAGARRVVHVSSLMVVWGHEGLVSGDAPPKPVGTYALTKMLGENVARYYAEAHDMEVITLRIAAPLDLGALTPETRVRPQQVPFPDLAQAFEKALTVPVSGYQVVTIVGESSRRIWDLEPARRILGYEPGINLDDLDFQWAEPFDVAP